MEFEVIRNKLRSYHFDTTVALLLNIIWSAEFRGEPARFWHPLLLIKWTLQYGGQNGKVKFPKKVDVYKLLQGLDKLEMSHATFDFKRNQRMIQTFTIISHQQFPYQDKAWLDSFSRQLLLFQDTDTKYSINSSFNRLTNLSIVEFLRILFALWMMIIHDKLLKNSFNGEFTSGAIKFLKLAFPSDQVDTFFTIITSSKEKFPEIIKEETRVKDHRLQVFETSIFGRKPLLLFKGKLFLPHKQLLNVTANHFIYDFMKYRDTNFTTEFGTRMELYIKLGINEASLKCTDENALRKQFGRDSKVVDFVVEDNVLIECKAIELKASLAVDPRDAKLGMEFRKSIAKAYASQMFTVASNLNYMKEWFGLIITYKPLYLGNSQDLWDAFLKDETFSIDPEFKVKSFLPVENLFLTDLRTWDRIVHILKNKKIKLQKILKYARKQDSNPATKTFLLQQHLEKFENQYFELKYLDDAMEYIKPQKEYPELKVNKKPKLK
ncbi:hypothetical protein [Owenweeksia hongkongensis]|uniref:hypothetical protein n=1 Tax=Owenweeksia hongkongensis TaxID=253245 RepID=UPI003A8DA91E